MYRATVQYFAVRDKGFSHTDIKHTVVYAHVVDKLKLDAVARLPKMSNNFLDTANQKTSLL